MMKDHVTCDIPLGSEMFVFGKYTVCLSTMKEHAKAFLVLFVSVFKNKKS